MRMPAVIFLLFCIFFHNLYGVNMSNDRAEEVKMYEKVRDALRSKDTYGHWPEGLLPLSQMRTDNSESIRREICFAIVEHLRNTNGTTADRRTLVEELTKSLQDPSPAVCNNVAEWLCVLKPDDFGPGAKIYIEKAFRKKHTKQLILLSGIADVSYVNEKIKTLVFISSVTPAVGRFYGTLEWGAELVRARKGDKNSIKNVLKAVEDENDMITKITVLLRELEYVHQPEIVIYLKKYLDSDERLEAVKPTVTGAKCAQYAAVALAQILESFPVVKEDINYTEKELNICRQWMSIQAGWIFK